MNRFISGLAGVCVLALASCASTGERASLQTALVSTEVPAPAGGEAIENIMTGSISSETPMPEPAIQLGSIHSHIVPGAGASNVPAPGAKPLAGRTIYIEETRDLVLAPKEVVLTFDDGPVPYNTRSVLDALDAHGVKGLFFMVGEMASWHPEAATAVIADEQTIGSHTFSHPNLPALGTSGAIAEIDHGVASVTTATGVTPHFFRYPYLAENEALNHALQSRGIIPVGIDVDSRDYQPSTTEEIIARIMHGLEGHGGGIVLMHDLQGRTARAIGPLLDRLEADGYKVVTLRYGKPPEETPGPLLAGVSGRIPLGI